MITEWFQIFASNDYIQKNNIREKEEKKNKSELIIHYITV
jgi:hypothetical protein